MKMIWILKKFFYITFSPPTHHPLCNPTTTPPYVPPRKPPPMWHLPIDTKYGGAVAYDKFTYKNESFQGMLY
jgi:hypothetical protein